MKRLSKYFIALAVVVAMSIPMLAQRGPGMQHAKQRFGRHFGLARMLHDPTLRATLSVTDEQYAKLKTAFESSAKAAIKDQADLKIKRLELASLMDSDKVDRDQVDKKIGEISALQTALMKTHIETQLAVKETLTPDQLAKFHQWRQSEVRHWMEQGMRMRMGRMQRPDAPRMGPQGPRPPMPPPPPKPGDEPGQ